MNGAGGKPDANPAEAPAGTGTGLDGRGPAGGKHGERY